MNIAQNLALGTIFAFAVLAAPAQAAAVDGKTSKTVSDAVHKLIPGATIDSIDASPIPGVYTVIAGGQVAYVSADGKYLMHGSLYDIDQRMDLTESRMDGIRRAELAKVPATKRVEFAPADPRYRVTVFTDFDCGYCRKLHSQIEQYNKAGIAVDYLFYPRSGLNTPSYDKAVSVWCAKDRHGAFTQAKLGAEPERATCTNPVAEEYAMGQRLGITGTPTVIASDGSVIGGYLAPEQMLQRLQSIETRQATAVN